MNSKSESSSTYKNLRLKHTVSPIELKEKMRKNYRNRIQSCRDVLRNKFRGPLMENEIRNSLANIYKELFNFSEYVLDQEENEILERIQNELVQEELDWWSNEYEKSYIDTEDWATIEQDKSVICPVCQKDNLNLKNNTLCCSNCKFLIETVKTIDEIKNIILHAVDSHAGTCSNTSVFSVVNDLNDSHIYLICCICAEMKLIV